MSIGDKAATLVFWLVVGGIALLGSGWIIYVTLDQFITRQFLGRNPYPDSPEEWPLFWGCVAIFTLGVLGMRECYRKLFDGKSGKSAS